MRRTSDDVIYANVSWFSDGITPETVTWWGCLAGKVIFFLFLFFSLLSIYTIRVCKRVRSPVTKGRPNGRDLCHSQGRAAELLKSSRVLFSGSSSILFPRLFFYSRPYLSRAQRLASVFPTHVSPHDSAAADNQRRSFWNGIDPPPYIAGDPLLLPPTLAQSRRENVICIAFGILIFLDLWKRNNKLLRLYWERRDSVSRLDSPSIKRLVSRLSCLRYTSTLSLSLWSLLASFWLTGVHSNFPRAANWTSSFTMTDEIV